MPPYHPFLLLPLSPNESTKRHFKRSRASMGVPAVKTPPSLKKRSRNNNNGRPWLKDFGQLLLEALPSDLSPTDSSTVSSPTKSSPTKSSTVSSSPTKSSTVSSSPTKSSTSTIERFMSTPHTPIPEEFQWIRDISTAEERRKFLSWVRAAASEANPVERMRLSDWSSFVRQTFVKDPPPHEFYKYLTYCAHSTSNNAAPSEHKRLLKPAHSKARISAPGRWSLQEEVIKPFEIAMRRIQREIKKKALKHSYPGDRYPDSIQEHHPIDKYPDLTQEHMIYSYKGEPGVYQCQDALWMWAELIDFLTSDKGPKYVGEKITEKFPKFPKFDMIEETPSINELGLITIKLSGKWIAKSIHEMLKRGIDTWAPKLPVERVIVAYPSSDEDVPVDLFRLLPIAYTLMALLQFSKVDATMGHPMDVPKSFEWDGISAPELLNRWFLCEERKGEILIKGKVPFILQKRDYQNAYKDIFALRYGLREHKADWIVYVTPVRQQVYIETCFAAAKIEGWISSNKHNQPRTSYAGCRSCNIELKEKLLDKAKIRSLLVSKGEAAKLLGYSAEAVFNCVFRYTILMNHRLAVCTFNSKMFNEKGNTFVYLLNTQAQIRKMTNAYRKDINELKKASEIILEKDKGWEKCEERVLGCHLLEFTSALEECCLCVLPHVLCEYLYSLCNKFNSYHSSVCKDGSIVDTSALLLYEATAVVMKKCFHLLGITPPVAMEKCLSRFGITPKLSCFGSSLTELLLGLLFSRVERPMDINARDLTRNSRFEMFSFRTRPLSPRWYAKVGGLFGLISVSEKSVPSRSHFFEPEVAHVPVFQHEWCNPIEKHDLGLLYPTNPGSGCSVKLSSSIQLCTELYIISPDKKESYKLCNQKTEISMESLWNKNTECVCGEDNIITEHGTTQIYYILLKDAVDCALKVVFETRPETPAREVRGYVEAYYGDEFMYECLSDCKYKESYMALLFRAVPSYKLRSGDIKLIRSFLAVPTKGSLIIKAYLEDINSKEVLINGTCNFKPLLIGCSSGDIKGSDDCSLNVEVSWNYQNRYL